MSKGEKPGRSQKGNYLSKEKEELTKGKIKGMLGEEALLPVLKEGAEKIYLISHSPETLISVVWGLIFLKVSLGENVFQLFNWLS